VEIAAYVEDDEEDVAATHEDEEHVGESSTVEPSPTRRDCVMGVSKALNKLTKEEGDNEEEAEWLIIKALKKGNREMFMVDYCDGDAEDEFQWLEGPHSPEHTSVADLLDRRRSQPRTERRRQGHTIRREDSDMECKSQEDKVCDLTGEEITLVDLHILGFVPAD
jgi:hypothetical protein